MCFAWFQLLQLLLKASQDKKFVCEEADRALNSMVASLTPLPLLHKLRAYVCNPLQPPSQSKGRCIHLRLHLQNGSRDNERVWVGEADLDGSRFAERQAARGQAREAARSTVISLYRTSMEHVEEKQEEAWQKVLPRVSAT
ncbi:hypothetical protein SAY86_007930 [Trapa natans]|uniref:Uncharacterized protein n=1 Tax=Trapa natans TaxID=22666 RepID=A0AAN7R176_TRANT|nr:hypothetical protein SAY86_007930 [Trapa natans]